MASPAAGNMSSAGIRTLSMSPPNRERRNAPLLRLAPSSGMRREKPRSVSADSSAAYEA